MLTLLAALALLVLLGALLFVGVTAIAGALGSRSAGPPVAMLAAGAIAAVVVLVGLTVGLGLARGGSDPEVGDERGATVTTAPRRERPPRPRPPLTVEKPSPGPVPLSRTALGPRVDMPAGAGTGVAPAAAVGELVPGTVLRVEARDFPSFATARARQCSGMNCGNDVVVHMSDTGTASFLFLVTDTLGGSPDPEACRVTSAPCSLVLENTDGEGRAQVPMLFYDAVPEPGQLRVTPARDLADGSRITVHLDGFPRDSSARLVMCARGASDAGQQCGRPGLDVPVAIGRDGTATVTATIKAGPVGASRIQCGRGSGCSLAVVSDDAFVRAQPVRLGLRAPPGVSYDGSRLALGLALAALLLLAAVVLVRRTDWSPLGEEAAPEIDEAEYADLDAIVAALPPEPDLDELIAALG